MPNSLTFGGYPFRLASERVREFVDRYYPLDHLWEQGGGGQRSRNMRGLALPRGPAVRPRLNDLYYPTGATRWALFRGLMTGADAERASGEAFAGDTATPLPFVMEANGERVETALYMLPPRPVADVPGRRAGTDSLHLVTLVDERYYWQFRGASLIVGGTPWEELIVDLESALGIDLDYDVPASAYGEAETDSDLWSNSEPAGVLLDAVAQNVGCVLVRRYDGSYRLARWADANAVALAEFDARTSQAGGAVLPFDSGVSAPARAAVLPRRVSVTFPIWIDGKSYAEYANEGRAFRKESYSRVDAVTVAAADLGTPYDTYPTLDLAASLRTTAKAVYWTGANASVVTATTPPADNQTALDALAQLLAKDLYDRCAVGADASFAGVAALDPECACDLLFAWSGRGKPYTRASRAPWDAGQSEFQHGFGALVSAVPFPYISGTPFGSGTIGHIVRWAQSSPPAVGDSGATVDLSGNVTTPGSGSFGAVLRANGTTGYLSELSFPSGNTAALILSTPTRSLSFSVSNASTIAQLVLTSHTEFRLVGGVFGCGTSSGLTGALGPGAEATGGIVTNLGTGSFGDATQAGNNTFSGNNSVTGSMAFDSDALQIRDADGSHGLAITPGSDLTAGRTFTLTTGDANRTLDISAGNVTVTSAGNALTSAASAGAQRTVLGLGTADAPTFAGGTFTGAVGVTGTVTATTFSGSGASLTALPSAQLTGALPAISGAALTALSSSALSGALPAISGAALTSLTAANLSGEVAVANGGTGRASHTAYAVICGGTTSTGAQQSIAGVGTAGHVLTSNGAGALPTFQAPATSLDITGLTAADFGWRDEVPVYSQENAANRKLDVERVAAVAHCPPPGRLTLDSALPVSTADVTSSSTLYYLSLNGDRIRLWDGTRYVVRRIGAGLVTTQTWTSSKNYDVWAYASAYAPSATNTGTDVVTVATSPPTGSSVLCTTSAGGLTVGTVYYWNQASGTTGSFHTTLANALAGTSKVDLTANVTGVLLFASLETLVWTNDSTRATALALTDGLYHKSGDQTRLYLGTVRVGSLGTIFDTVAARGVWNVHNRRKRAMRAVKTSGSWTYATNTWRSANADATLRCEFVLGIAEDAVIGDVVINYTGSSSAGAVGIGLDQTAGNDAQIVCEAGPAGATDDQTTRARYAGTPAAGYHYLQWIEKVRAGTATFRADLTPSVGLEVEVWA